MKDGEGRDIDFKNTVIILTSNAGTDLITKLFADPETAPDAAALAEALRPELLKYFKPAFLGRVTLVPYFPLSDDVHPPDRRAAARPDRAAGCMRLYRAEFDYDAGARRHDRGALHRNLVRRAQRRENPVADAACPNCRPRCWRGSAEGGRSDASRVGMDSDGSVQL